MREKTLCLLTILMIILSLCACGKASDSGLKSTTMEETAITTERLETEFVEAESENETTTKTKSANKDKKYAKPSEAEYLDLEGT